jgi:hypothetical protein
MLEDRTEVELPIGRVDVNRESLAGISVRATCGAATLGLSAERAAVAMAQATASRVVAEVHPMAGARRQARPITAAPTGQLPGAAE